MILFQYFSSILHFTLILKFTLHYTFYIHKINAFVRKIPTLSLILTSIVCGIGFFSLKRLIIIIPPFTMEFFGPKNLFIVFTLLCLFLFELEARNNTKNIYHGCITVKNSDLLGLRSSSLSAINQN